MRVLITGGTGFIGSRLALRCLARTDTVRVYGQINTPAETDNKQVIEAAGAEVVLGAMTDREKLVAITKDIDIVFHLAAAQHEANMPDQVFWDVNVEGTRNMLDAAVASGVKKFVHGSTIGVYGTPAGLITEQSPCNPDNIYGITKLAGEKLVLSYNKQLPTTAIRISETYGPGDRRLLKLFKMIRKRRFFHIGDGTNLHHLIYIDDLIKGMLLAAESDKANGEAFLLAGEKPLTTNEMIATIATAVSSPQPKFRAPLGPFLMLASIMEAVLKPFGIQPPLHRRRMDFFKKSFSIATQKAAALLGFAPEYSFARGAEQTADWYEKMGYLGNGEPQNGTNSREGGQLQTDFKLTAVTEPFDTFWEAPKNIEKGYESFGKFYKRNYLDYIPANKDIRILAISCGPGYFLSLLKSEGYRNVLGIDSDPQKVQYALDRHLNCKAAHAFDFLTENEEPFDLIFVEQEINHLTKEEILQFLKLCWENLAAKGMVIVHSLNGANPVTGPEALAQNFDHYNTFTEYSLKQILKYSQFSHIQVFPLKLYIFYENPFNYVGMAIDAVLNLIFRASFIFYGKSNKIFSKKISAIAKKN